ncbi:MAG: ADP-glyceromanno-heptose 6-epimerase [Bdellovibrionales bacterium]|nr:ADP-glyceromanno-heptose 6-epimerase [Bdellovibrionales bacterium]
MYIVTGGAGFIGSTIVSKLNADGIDDILIVDELEADPKWKNLRNLKFEDYLDKEDFIDLITDNSISKNVQAIIHMGACSSTSETDMSYLMENNYRYTKTLCEYSIRNKIRFIYASSGATYGLGEKGYSDSNETTKILTPISPYGYSKHVFDLWAIKHGIDKKIVGLKFFNVYGPNEYHKLDGRSVIYNAYHQIKDTGKALLFKSYKNNWKNGEQQRDFVYIKDCVEVVNWFLSKPKVNGIFNCGTGKCRTFLDLANSVFAAINKQANIEFIEMPENLQPQYQYYTEAKMSKLTDSGCPVKFRSLEEGVKDYVQNYLENNAYL